VPSSCTPQPHHDHNHTTTTPGHCAPYVRRGLCAMHACPCRYTKPLAIPVPFAPKQADVTEVHTVSCTDASPLRQSKCLLRLNKCPLRQSRITSRRCMQCVAQPYVLPVHAPPLFSICATARVLGVRPACCAMCTNIHAHACMSTHLSLSTGMRACPGYQALRLMQILPAAQTALACCS